MLYRSSLYWLTAQAHPVAMSKFHQSYFLPPMIYRQVFPRHTQPLKEEQEFTENTNQVEQSNSNQPIRSAGKFDLTPFNGLPLKLHCRTENEKMIK